MKRRQGWLYAVDKVGNIQRWPLSARELLVGRKEIQDPAGKLGVEGDRLLSRRHFTAVWDGSSLRVRRCAEAGNPLYYKGEAASEFRVPVGGHFVAGLTEFQVVAEEVEERPAVASSESTLAHNMRERLREHQARVCLVALTRLLPRLRASEEEANLWQATLDVLQGLLPKASEVLAIEVDSELLDSGGEDYYTVMLAVGQSLTAALIPPSRRLLQMAFEKSETALQVWEGSPLAELSGITHVAGVTWALASPVEVSPGERYALYAVGRVTNLREVETGALPPPGQEERVLVDLVAEALSHYLVERRMHQLQGQISQFFSPSLRVLLERRGFDEVLRPARREVSVMFFDLRGFTRATEEGEFLNRALAHFESLSEVMTSVTGLVFEQEGIVIDFQGDALLACWGTPFPTDDHPLRCVRAARAVVKVVHEMRDLFGVGSALRCGLGLDSGPALSGRVGGRHQTKFGVMGSVVNRASRLEGLTKFLGAPVLTTEPVARALRDEFLFRRVGRVRLSGFEEPTEVHELVLPRPHGGTGLTEAEVGRYEEAEAAYRDGNLRAVESLVGPQLEKDPVSRFLVARVKLLAGRDLGPDWDGVLGAGLGKT